MKEKKYLKISLGTGILLALIVILIVALVGMYFYYNPKENKENNKNIVGETDNLCNTTNIENNVPNEDTKTDNTKNPYEKYSDLEWYFDKKLVEVQTGYGENDDEKFIIKNGILYFEKDGDSQRINSITEKAKYLIPWGSLTLERIYVITEERNIWRIGSSPDLPYRDVLEGILNTGQIDKFDKIKLPDKVVDMTDGNQDLQICEYPYFLLESGKLINEEGNAYEDLDGNFKKSLGNIRFFQVFIGQDNSLSYFNYETKKYVKIKDETGNIIKIEDAFFQYNNDITVFIIDENKRLLYVNQDYSITNSSNPSDTLIAKEYEQAKNKFVKSVKEDTTEFEITFTDETKIQLSVQRNLDY